MMRPLDQFILFQVTHPSPHTLLLLLLLSFSPSLSLFSPHLLLSLSSLRKRVDSLNFPPSFLTLNYPTRSCEIHFQASLLIQFVLFQLSLVISPHSLLHSLPTLLSIAHLLSSSPLSSSRTSLRQKCSKFGLQLSPSPIWRSRSSMRAWNGR